MMIENSEKVLINIFEIFFLFITWLPWLVLVLVLVVFVTVSERRECLSRFFMLIWICLMTEEIMAGDGMMLNGGGFTEKIQCFTRGTAHVFSTKK